MRATLATTTGLLMMLALPAAAQPLTDPFRVNTATTGNELFPSAAAISDVQYIVVWGAPDGSGSGIYGRRFTVSGQPVAPDFLVDSYTTGNATKPSVGSDQAGNFVVVWQDPPNVFGQRFSFAGAPLGGIFQVNTSTAYSKTPAVAVAPAGDFAVMWVAAEDGAGQAVMARRFLSSGAPSGAPFVVNTYTTGNQNYASIAAGTNGYVVAWSSTGHAEDLKTGVYARRFLFSGGPVGSEFHVNSHTTGYDDLPAVAVNRTNGSFVIVWRGETDGSIDSIAGQRYDSAGTALGGEFRVNTMTSGSQTQAAVAFDGSSTYIVAWASQTDVSYDVLAQRYSAAGPPLGADFRVSTDAGVVFYPNSYPALASAGTLGNRYLVSWIGQDAHLNGVYARAYCLVGDLNVDGTVNVGDVFYLINRLFAGGPTGLGCGDVNFDGSVDVGDVFYLINFLFAGGPPPL